MQANRSFGAVLAHLRTMLFIHRHNDMSNWQDGLEEQSALLGCFVLSSKMHAYFIGHIHGC